MIMFLTMTMTMTIISIHTNHHLPNERPQDAKEMSAWKDAITQAYSAIQARSSAQPVIAPKTGQPPTAAASLAGASFHERRVHHHSQQFPAINSRRCSHKSCRYRFGRILDKGSHGKVYASDP